MTSIETDSSARESHPTRLDIIEQIAKIFAVGMLPILVAMGGWIIQSTVERDKNALDKDKISLEYVKISLGILTSTEKEIPKELVRWSYRALNDLSPVKFDQDDLDRLIERQERIPYRPAPPPVTSPPPTNFTEPPPEPRRPNPSP